MDAETNAESVMSTTTSSSFMINEHEFLQKVIVFSLIKKPSKVAFFKLLEEGLFHENFNRISIIDAYPFKEIETFYPVILPKFGVYIILFSMKQMVLSPKETLRKIREHFDLISTYAFPSHFETAVDRPKLMLVGTSDEKFQTGVFSQQALDIDWSKYHNKKENVYSDINSSIEKLLHASPVYPHILVNSSYLFFPLSLKFSVKNSLLQQPSKKLEKIIQEITSYFSRQKLKLLFAINEILAENPATKLGECDNSTLSTNLSCSDGAVLPYSLWMEKIIKRMYASNSQSYEISSPLSFFRRQSSLRSAGNSTPTSSNSSANQFRGEIAHTIKEYIEEVTRTLCDLNIILWTRSVDFNVQNSLKESYVVLRPFVYFTCVADLLLRLNINDGSPRQNHQNWNKVLVDPFEKEQFQNFSIVSSDVFSCLFGNPAHGELMILMSLLLYLGIIAPCKVDVKVENYGNSDRNVFQVFEKMEKDKVLSEIDGESSILYDQDTVAEEKEDLNRKSISEPSGTPKGKRLLEFFAQHESITTLRRKYTLNHSSKKFNQCRDNHFYFLPYLPKGNEEKGIRSKELLNFSSTGRFYLLLVSKTCPLRSYPKFEFKECQLHSCIPHFFFQRLISRILLFQTLFFQSSMKKTAQVGEHLKLDQDESPFYLQDYVIFDNHFLFTVSTTTKVYKSSHLNEKKRIKIFYDKKYHLLQIDFENSIKNPLIVLEFLMNIIQSLLNEFHSHLSVLPAIEYNPSREKDGTKLLFSIYKLKEYFGKNYASAVTILSPSNSLNNFIEAADDNESPVEERKKLVPEPQEKNVQVTLLLFLQRYFELSRVDSDFPSPRRLKIKSTAIGRSSTLSSSSVLLSNSLSQENSNFLQFIDHSNEELLFSLKLTFEKYFQLFKKTKFSKNLILICWPSNIPQIKSDDSQFFHRINVEDFQSSLFKCLEANYSEEFQSFQKTFEKKNNFQFIQRPIRILPPPSVQSDEIDEWINSLFFSHHITFFYSELDFLPIFNGSLPPTQILRSRSMDEGDSPSPAPIPGSTPLPNQTSSFSLNEMESIFFEWIILLFFLKNFWEISHIKHFSMILFLSRDFFIERIFSNPEYSSSSASSSSTSNSTFTYDDLKKIRFFHELFPISFKNFYQNHTFRPAFKTFIKTKLMEYWKKMSETYHLRHSYQTTTNSSSSSFTAQSTTHRLPASEIRGNVPFQSEIHLKGLLASIHDKIDAYLSNLSYYDVIMSFSHFLSSYSFTIMMDENPNALFKSDFGNLIFLYDISKLFVSTHSSIMNSPPLPSVPFTPPTKTQNNIPPSISLPSSSPSLPPSSTFSSREHFQQPRNIGTNRSLYQKKTVETLLAEYISEELALNLDYLAEEIELTPLPKKSKFSIYNWIENEGDLDEFILKYYTLITVILLMVTTCLVYFISALLSGNSNEKDDGFIPSFSISLFVIFAIWKGWNYLWKINALMSYVILSVLAMICILYIIEGYIKSHQII